MPLDILFRLRRGGRTCAIRFCCVTTFFVDAGPLQSFALPPDPPCSYSSAGGLGGPGDHAPPDFDETGAYAPPFLLRSTFFVAASRRISLPGLGVLQCTRCVRCRILRPVGPVPPCSHFGELL